MQFWEIEADVWFRSIFRVSAGSLIIRNVESLSLNVYGYKFHLTVGNLEAGICTINVVK